MCAKVKKQLSYVYGFFIIISKLYDIGEKMMLLLEHYNIYNKFAMHHKIHVYVTLYLLFSHMSEIKCMLRYFLLSKNTSFYFGLHKKLLCCIDKKNVSFTSKANLLKVHVTRNIKQEKTTHPNGFTKSSFLDKQQAYVMHSS